MAAGDELRAKARELERAGRHQEALELYVRLADKADGGRAALLWQRVGAQRLRTGDPAGARDSYGRALDLYGEAGQPNNVLALSLDLVDSDDADVTVWSTILRGALDHGYLVFARSAIVPLLLHLIREGPDDPILRQIASFFQQAAGDSRSTPGALVESLPSADERASIPVLTELWAILTERAAVDIADRVRVEIVRIDPSSDPRPSAPRPDPGSVAPGTRSSLPLIEPMAFDGEPGSVAHVPRLEGLEPTHADFEVEPHTAGTENEPLDHAETELPDDSEDEETEPLPFLIPTAPTRRPAPQHPPEPAPVPAAPPDDELDTLVGDALDGLVDGRAPADSPDAWPAIPGLDVAELRRELEMITDREVGEADPASHYDVGVAFMEMGMIDDAIARLAAALSGGHNPLATLEVLGEILVEQGSFEVVGRVLDFARSADRSFDVELAGVLYWLARSDEALARHDDAQALFYRVNAVAPSFRDVRRRVAAPGAP